MNQKQMEVYGILSREWMTQADILEDLKEKYDRSINSRRLRTIIKECRMLYKESKVPMLVIKSNRGYKLSDNLDEIEKFTHELLETGQSMVTESQEILMAARNKTRKTECPSLNEYYRHSLEDMIQNKKFSHLQMIEISKGLAHGLTYTQIMIFAKMEMHPYTMFLCRKGLQEGHDEKYVKLYADENLSVSNVLLLHQYVSEGKEFEELQKIKKEMRDREDKTTDKGKS